MIQTPRLEPLETKPAPFDFSWPQATATPLVALVSGVNFECIATNESFDAFFGHRTGAGRALTDLIRFVDGEDLGALLQGVLQTGTPTSVDSRAVRMTEVDHGYFGVVLMDISCEPMLLADGQKPGVLVKAVATSVRPWQPEQARPAHSPAPHDFLLVDQDRVALALEVGQIGYGNGIWAQASPCGTARCTSSSVWRPA